MPGLPNSAHPRPMEDLCGGGTKIEAGRAMRWRNLDCRHNHDRRVRLPIMAHGVISLRYGIWSLSGHSGPGKPSGADVRVHGLNSFVSLRSIFGCATMGEVTR